MRGGLAASCTKMRVAKPRVVTSSARIMGVKARWVTLAAQVLEDPLCLVLGVELVVLYGLLVGLFDLRLRQAWPVPLLIELDAEGSVGADPGRPPPHPRRTRRSTCLTPRGRPA